MQLTDKLTASRDCEGPRVTSSTGAATAIPAASEIGSSLDPGPSPTASIGCEPHGDHWDCEGPRATDLIITTTAIPVASTSSHDENAPMTGSNLDPGPSPTASIGCIPHGDHWDCEGPVPVTGASSSGTGSGILATATSATSAAPAQFTGAGSVVSLDRSFVAAIEAGVMGLGIFFAAA